MSMTLHLPLGVRRPGHLCDVRGSRSCRVLWGEGRPRLLPGSRDVAVPPPSPRGPGPCARDRALGGSGEGPACPHLSRQRWHIWAMRGGPPTPGAEQLSPWRQGAAGGLQCPRPAPPYRAAAEPSGAGAAPRRAAAARGMGPGGRRAGAGLSASE